MNRKTNVLVVDSDRQILRALRIGLGSVGFATTLCQTGEQGLEELAGRMADAVILDCQSKVDGGVPLCQHLREWSNVPIIVISTHSDEEHKIAALEAGADDYLTKPIGVGELIARLKAVLRRVAGEQPESIFTCGPLTVDYGKRLVLNNGQPVHLTPKEYDLLKYMTLNADRLLTHRQILTQVWGDNVEEEHHTLRVHVANLRNKIERNPQRPELIRTEVRIGYRFQTTKPGTLSQVQ